jgi:putative exosortase-associated protein (TIGR04073 family)
MRVPRWSSLALAMTVLMLVGVSARAEYSPAPETILNLMSIKFWRGLTNVVTSPAELPKQIYKDTRDMGAVGVPVGLLQGVGMTAYRAAFGALETAFFFVPAPGEYDPMVEPPFVWQEWAKVTTAAAAQEQRTGP